MKHRWTVWILALGLVVAAGTLWFTGAWRPVAASLGLRSGHQEGQVYWCPMHPFYKVKRYGTCPYCNMALEPYAPGAGAREAEATLMLTPQQIQQAGVRIEKVLRRELVHEIETSGIVELNHERYWHIEFRFGGWVEEIFLHTIGEPVKAGAPIAKVYSPTLYADQDKHLTTVKSGDAQMIASSRRRLELMGVDETEIQELEKRQSPTDRLTVRSRYSGVVTHLNVKAGMKVPDDGHIADIADLRELWAFADIYDRDLPHVALGQEVRLAAGTRTSVGKIDLIEPRVRAETQTARVRIRVPNDPISLYPGQFVRALVVRRLPGLLAVSEHAVIPTGRRDLVILALGGGRFTAREVKIGRRWLTGADAGESRELGFFTGHNRFHEVLVGLEEGEEVVTSGAFLLHAETQIRNLIEKMTPESKAGPVTRSAWTGGSLSTVYEADGLSFTDEQEAERFRASPERSWHRRAPEIRKTVGRMMDRSFLFHNAVSSENRKLAEEYAEGLAAEAGDLRSLISESFDPEIRNLLNGLADAAAGTPGGADLKDTMRRFGTLSAGLESFLNAFGNPSEHRLNQFYCGMAQKTVGSPTERWFQMDAELRNPFGMPGCGHLERQRESWAEHRPRIRASVAKILDPYLRIHQAITEDRSAQESAIQLLPILEALEPQISDDFGIDIAGPLRSFVTKFRQAASGMGLAKTPRETRKQFGAMSAAFEHYLAHFPSPIDGPLFQFTCGMAKDGVGSPTERWFQTDDQLRNPYGMPGCGKLERKLP